MVNILFDNGIYRELCWGYSPCNVTLAGAALMWEFWGIFGIVHQVKLIFGNRYGPRGSLRSSQGARTHDSELPTYFLALSSPREAGVAGYSPYTLTVLLAIPIPSSSSSNGPRTTPLLTRCCCPRSSVVWHQENILVREWFSDFSWVIFVFLFQKGSRFGWVFLERTWNVNEILVYKTFHRTCCCRNKTNSSLVIRTWYWRGKHAASARACLREEKET